jgi:hypothetical protein
MQDVFLITLIVMTVALIVFQHFYIQWLRRRWYDALRATSETVERWCGIIASDWERSPDRDRRALAPQWREMAEKEREHRKLLGLD